MSKKWKITPSFLIGIKKKHCSWSEICEDCYKICRPSTCKYFKAIVVPTWFQDMKRRHGKKFKLTKEFNHFLAVIAHLKRTLR